MAEEAWLSHVPIPPAQIHTIPNGPRADKAAEAYAQTLRGVGYFDLTLLGLGADGHTASLFPGNDWGMAPDSPDTLAVFNSPKRPPQRVSLSAARLNRSRRIIFLVSGESKHKAVARWRAGEKIPARAIMGENGVDILVESTLLLPSKG
jgi:6-phosphogluconolactonase